MSKGDDAYIKWWLARNEAREDGDLAFAGHAFHVPKTVFTPDPEITNSTTLLWEMMPQVARKSVLDLGAGCGVLGLSCALNGAASVTLADIDPAALAAARHNVSRHYLTDRVEVVASDLFNNVAGRYDIVIANLPLADAAWTELSESPASIFSRFLDQCAEHTNPGARLLTSTASFANVANLPQIFAGRGYEFERRDAEKFGVHWTAFRVAI